jgi:dTDP-4-amino-4,6-dideoxygalactose transaminase
LEEAGLVQAGMITPPRPVYERSGDKNPHIYNQYTLRVKDRERLQAFLKAKGVMTAIYYPVPLHLQECFRGLGYRKGDFPQSEKAAAEVLSLPVYPELAAEQKDYVIDCLKKFYRG